MFIFAVWALAAGSLLAEQERLLPQLLPLVQHAESFQAARPPALVRSSVTMQMEAPSDDLRPRFARTKSEERTKTSFAPARAEPAPTVAKAAEGSRGPKSNEKLLAEIRELMPAEKEAAPERKKEDLNGLRPSLLLLGASTYAVVAFIGVQLTIAAGNYFASNAVDEDTFYVVQRFSAIARTVVIAMLGLGTSVTTIASLGQFALCVRVAIGIATGELDPMAEREDLYGAKKQSKMAQMLLYMTGNKDIINDQ